MATTTAKRERQRLHTLDEFLTAHRAAQPVDRSEDVTFPGWRRLYVRYGRIYKDGAYVDGVITLANIEAKVTGKGTFRKLVAYLRETYPDAGIQTECVETQQFCEGLVRMGFMPFREDVQSNCFFLPTIQPSPDVRPTPAGPRRAGTLMSVKFLRP